MYKIFYSSGFPELAFGEPFVVHEDAQYFDGLKLLNISEILKNQRRKRRNLDPNERGLINMFAKIKQVSKRIFAEELNVEQKNESKEVPAVPHTETISIAGCKFIYKGKQNIAHTDYYFIINDKEYTEDFFQKTLEVDLYNGTKQRYLDKNGRTVFSLLERIPTFDSSDREYDSYKMLLIFEENGIMNGIYLRGGYSYAETVEYTGLSCADDITKEMIEKLKTIEAQ